MGIGKLAAGLGEGAASKKKKKTGQVEEEEDEEVEETPAKAPSAGPTEAVKAAMLEMGERFAELYGVIKGLEEEQAKLKVLLLPFMQEHCPKGKLTLEDGSVLNVKTSKRKQPNKGDLCEAFGTTEVDAFWDSLEPKESTYIEVKQV